MSKLLLPLLGIGLVIWLIGSTIWLNNYQQKSIQDETPESNFVWQLRDGDSLIHETSTIFAFQQSQAEMLLIDAQEMAFKKLVLYLDRHHNRLLELEGIYHPEESYTGSFEDLGYARAQGLAFWLARQGVRPEQIHCKSVTTAQLPLNENGLISGGINFTFSERPQMNYGETFRFRYELPQLDTTQLILPADFKAYQESLRQYLSDHPREDVLIQAFHSEPAVAQIWLNQLTQQLVQGEWTTADFRTAISPEPYLPMSREGLVISVRNAP